MGRATEFILDDYHFNYKLQQVATEQTISPPSNVWLELQDILFRKIFEESF